MTLLGTLIGARPVQSEVTRIEITTRTLYEGGKRYGERGQYERIRRRVFFAVDPLATANETIIDLEPGARGLRCQQYRSFATYQARFRRHARE